MPRTEPSHAAPSGAPPPHARPALPVWLGFAFLLVFAAAAALYRVRTFDTMFHLAAGRYALETGAFPQHDPFSFTFRGAAWLNHSPGFQLLVASAHRAYGFAALSLLQAVVACGLMALALWPLRSCPRLLPAAGLLAALPFVALREVLEARPHALGFVCLAAALNALLRFLGGAPPWALFPIVVVYAAWATLHGSHVMLPVLLGLAAFGTAVQARWARAGALLACGAACVGLALWLAPTAFEQGAEHLASAFLEGSVAEWRPLQPGDLFATWPGAAFLACWLLTCVGIARALRQRGALDSAARERAPELAMLLALMLFSLSSRRMLALYWFGAAPLFLRYAALALEPGCVLLRNHFTAARVRVLATLTGLALSVALVLQPEFQFGAGLAHARFPERAVAAMQRSGRIHRIYNAYNFGGYLIYARFPTSGVFIDGRAVTVYPESFLRRFTRAYAEPAEFEALVREYRIDGVLLARASPLSDPLARHLERSSRWQRTYQDEVAAVYEPRAPRDRR